MKLSEVRAMLHSLSELPDDADVFFRLGHKSATVNLAVYWDSSSGKSEVHLRFPRDVHRRAKKEVIK